MAAATCNLFNQAYHQQSMLVVAINAISRTEAWNPTAVTAIHYCRTIGAPSYLCIGLLLLTQQEIVVMIPTEC